MTPRYEHTVYTRTPVRETPDIVTSSDDYARRFSGRAGEYFLRIQRETIQKVLGNSFGMSVLDVGGGHAQLVPTLLDRECRLTVFGSSPVCHVRLKRQIENQSLTYVTGDLLNLPFRDNSYDVVISVRLISHVCDWQQLIKEFCRVAENVVVLDYPSLLSMNLLTPLLFRFKQKIEGNTRTYRSFFEKEIAREFNKHGFQVTDREGQFFIPMFVHRALKGTRYLQSVESIFKRAKVTASFSSPVILRLDRRVPRRCDVGEKRPIADRKRFS